MYSELAQFFKLVFALRIYVNSDIYEIYAKADMFLIYGKQYIDILYEVAYSGS